MTTGPLVSVSSWELFFIKKWFSSASTFFQLLERPIPLSLFHLECCVGASFIRCFWQFQETTSNGSFNLNNSCSLCRNSSLHSNSNSSILQIFHNIIHSSFICDIFTRIFNHAYIFFLQPKKYQLVLSSQTQDYHSFS